MKGALALRFLPFIVPCVTRSLGRCQKVCATSVADICSVPFARKPSLRKLFSGVLSNAREVARNPSFSYRIDEPLSGERYGADASLEQEEDMPIGKRESTTATRVLVSKGLDVNRTGYQT